MEAIPPKDIAIAALGASAALAAVLLVFVGFLFARADAVPGDVADSVSAKYRRAAVWGMLPVVICALVIVASFEWLFRPASGFLWMGWRYGFWIEMVVFVGYAAASVRILADNYA